MKKIIAVLLCAVLLLNCGVALAAQAPSVQEDKLVRVVIDGTPLNISNVAVIKDKKLMLSTEIFSGLGISKSGQVWDKTKTKLTLTKGKTKLVMQINSSTATLNGVKKTVAVKPFMYKNKAYFPIDFLADSFSKIINKDTQTNTYFLKDKAAYAKNKSLLDGVLKSMNSVSKLKSNETAELAMSGNGVNFDLLAPTTTLMDRVSKTAVTSIDYKTNTNGEASQNKIQIVMKDNAQFTQADGGEWEKQEMSADEFSEQFTFDSLIKYDNVILSALTSSNGANKDEVVLKGNVIMGDSVPTFLESQGLTKNTFSYKYVEITINKNTNLVSKIVLREAGITDLEGLKFNFSVNYQMNFSDINGTFDVVFPEDLKQ